MKHYLFFINQLYAYSILRPLQVAIRQRGDEVAWYVHGTDDQYLRNDERQLHTVAEVQAYQPAAVFVPGNWAPDFFPGIKVEVFHGLANDETGKKGHYKIRGLFDLYCTHAPTITRKFTELANQYGTFGVTETGWPKLDPFFKVPEQIQLDIQALRKALNTKKPVVLYASTFSPSLTSASQLVDAIKNLSALGRWHWLVTLHPKMPIDVVEQYRKLSGPDFTFIESNRDVLPLLQVADVMLCDTSSIALEFMLLDKPVVTFRTKVPGAHVINVLQTTEIEGALSQALSNPDDLMKATRQYSDALHVFRDGQSSERMLQAVDDFILHKKGHLKPKPLNLWRKYQMRKKMRYYHIS